jgi:hypothetical protein
MDILERNLQNLYERLMLIAEDTYYFHLDNQSPMSDEDKMMTTFNLYEAATNDSLPNTGGFTLTDLMKGRLSNTVQSYEFMDNPRFKKIQHILDFTQENFGFIHKTAQNRPRSVQGARHR